MAKSRGDFQNWEGRYGRGQFVRLSKDMLISVAWYNLTAHAKVLYLAVKTKYKGEVYGDKFTYTYKEALEKLRFNNVTFKNAKDCLIKNGFIEVVENNRHLKKKNVYKFSAEWIKAGFLTQRTHQSE